MTTPAPTLRDRLVGRLVGVPLGRDDEARFQEERRQRNRRNARGTVIALVPVHVLVAILLDFGISKVHVGPDATGRNDVVGTPIYMSPEQIADPSSVGAPSDVYALGVVLHELIAGTPPFSGSAIALLDHHVHQPAPRLADAVAPPELSALILRCLSKDPAARPTARALADELAAFADAAGAPAVEVLPRPAVADRTVRLR